MAHPNLAAIKDGPLDDSLTNLTWLQSLNVMHLGAPTPPITPDPPHDNMAKAGLKVNPNQVLGTSYLPAAASSDAGYYSPYGSRTVPGIPSLEKIDYKTNPLVKPPYSYATLICMAMAESKKTKITLAAIYNWITENFMYYRMADPSWQNSIRHNLSLNKCFEKVPRRKDEPGKGGFWRINPQYSDLLENGTFKKRRGSNRDVVGGSCAATAAAVAAVAFGGGRRSRREGASDESSDCTASKRKRKADQQHHLLRRHQALANDDDDANTLSLGDDVTFNALLRQDIEINGVRMKTEDLIDGRDGEIAGSLMALSPSASDDDDDDSSADNFDELLRAHLADLNPTDGVADQMGGAGASGYGFGLMVHGVRIEPPEWWAESLGASGFRGALQGSQHGGSAGSGGVIGSGVIGGGVSGGGGGGLHTPPPASSSPAPTGAAGHRHHMSSSAAEAHHPWSTNRSELDEAIAALDMDTIFGMHD